MVVALPNHRIDEPAVHALVEVRRLQPEEHEAQHGCEQDDAGKNPAGAGHHALDRAKLARKAAPAMPSPPPNLSLVIPAYSEARRLPRTMRAVAGFGEEFIGSWEVLVVVEPGADGTLDLAERFAAGQANFRVIGNEAHRGKGFAVRTGMLAAEGDIIFYMDADLSVPLAEIPRFLAHFEENPDIDVLVGNRQHAQSRITRRQSALRRRMGIGFNQILRALGMIELRDTQCGFKGFRREAARAVFSRAQIDGFAFDLEALLLASRLGFKVADLPVEWHNSPDSRVHIVRDSASMLRDALRVRRLVDRALRENPAKP